MVQLPGLGEVLELRERPGPKLRDLLVGVLADSGQCAVPERIKRLKARLAKRGPELIRERSGKRRDQPGQSVRRFLRQRAHKVIAKEIRPDRPGPALVIKARNRVLGGKAIVAEQPLVDRGTHYHV